MTATLAPANPFALASLAHHDFTRKLLAAVEPPLGAALGIHRIARLYAQLRAPAPTTADAATADNFPERVLRALDITCAVTPEDRERIPRTGPLMIVANHPFGVADAMTLLRLVQSVRPDVRLVANALAARVPELAPHLVLVDPYGGTEAVRANRHGVREALGWVRDGHALILFPAGAVARFSWRRGHVVDPQWVAGAARLVRLTGAPVLPIHVAGHNGPFFQLAGLLHPQARTVLMPRALLRQRHHRVSVRIGAPLPATELARFAGDAALAAYLRFRVYLLAPEREPHAPAGGLRLQCPPRPHAAPQAPLAEPIAGAALAAEIAALPAAAKLLSSGACDVYCARAAALPQVLQELGRLRELSFRAAGEGTGQPSDLDEFDADYLHLFVWDRGAQELVGAYRLGLADEQLTRRGPAGLYAATLFRARPEFFARLGPALELGRAFVQPKYQRQMTALPLLWKGIATFVARNPRYAVLYGGVSISNDYRPRSRELLRRYLETHAAAPELACHVRPQTPFPRLALGEADPAAVLPACPDVDEVSTWIGQLEADGKGVPILIKHYLKLGGRVLAFNLDHTFADTVDGLIVVDFRRSDARVLARYMGREGAAGFFAHHGVAPRAV